MKFSDLNLRSIGNTVQLTGAIYSGDGKTYLCFLPDETNDLPVETLEMTLEEWKDFLRQSDLMEVEVLAHAKDGASAKAVIRKSQWQIDAAVSWRVFKRDGYKCRYCGRDDVPLTVDHVVCWEAGGSTVEANLLSSCKKCNRVRGDLPYAEWLQHEYYKKVSKNLSELVRLENKEWVDTIPYIPLVNHVRSR
jgi:hypothetical protein